MHFRLRKSAVQVIRTTYDASTKKGKSEIVGRIPKGSLEIPEALAKACTPAELKEISAWIREYSEYHKLKQEFAAKSLPEQLTLAGEWFGQAKGDGARALAASIQREWGALRVQLKKQSLIE